MDQLSDDELHRRYLDAPDTEGEAFFVIYARYYVSVLHEMEDAGLSPQEAENRIGAVFTRALSQSHAAGGNTLRGLLLAYAREVASDPAACGGTTTPAHDG